jgi:hypothetical protein
MRAGAGGYCSQKITGNNSISIGTTNSDLWSFSEWVDSAGPHGANSAAYSEFSESTLRRLCVEPVPCILLAAFGHVIYNLLSCFVGTAFFQIHKRNLSYQSN